MFVPVFICSVKLIKRKYYVLFIKCDMNVMLLEIISMSATVFRKYIYVS